MAATPAVAGRTGFCFPQGTSCSFCGRLFLAWVFALLPSAEKEQEVLAR
jgi:hypothetical protein